MEPLQPISGEDPNFLDAVEHVSRLALIDKPCLIVGERGTGKELFTTRLHYLSRRWDRPLLKVNCAALNESLLESELFGHEAGAFTGADRRHVGRFERAEGGTLILDEIASASPAIQEKVLRIVEYGELERVWCSETIQVDVRVVGASNVDLPRLARTGKFRADLLDRLAFDVVTIPPLRARQMDILPLAQGFAIEISQELGYDAFAGFGAPAAAELLAHAWPGNVRELKNAVERAVYLHADPEQQIERIVIDPFASPWRPSASLAVDPGGDMPGGDERAVPPAADDAPHPELPVDFALASERFQRALVQSALEASEWNQTEGAKLLNLSYHQFRRLIKKLDPSPNS
jgi:psp operon transcriptional activator